MEKIHESIKADLEDTTPNPLEYPIGYFDAQVRFAQRWSQLGVLSFSDALLQKTAITRRLFGQAPPTADFLKFTELLEAGTSVAEVTNTVYAQYASLPHSHYNMLRIKNAFGFQYDSAKELIKIHFTNPKRGERPFSAEHMPERRAEFERMLQNATDLHPEAKDLMSASWLRSTKTYQGFSPNPHNPEVSLMRPEMKFGGNSVWGQFMDYNGRTNSRIYTEFIERLSAATDIEGLLQAFPYPTMQAVDPIGIYYEHYGIKSEFSDK